ncbi:putative BRCT domain-containing protein [Helianthus annuus]|nr:putative BRCT domain-containing protein [Helianthus annuus]
MIATAFDYTEEEETQIVNFDEETEELDITNFAGDLRALMVEDSDDVIALDSEDDEVISEPKDGKVRGSLWRRVSAVGVHSFEVKSSAGSNLNDKVTDNGPNSLQHTRYQETLTGISSEKNIISNNENGAVNESQEPGESTQADALKFVDHYLSISVENSSPEVKIPKTIGIKSPFTSFAKGSHELAKKANRMNRIGISTFDWDGNQPDSDERLFDQHVEEELPKCPPEKDTFDVSFNTQMAAEVMESFLCAPPPAIYANENEDTNKKTLKQFSSPLRDVINLNENGDTKKQKELNVESSTGNLKVRDKSSKVVTKRKQNQDLEKENIRFVYKRRGSLGENQKVKTFSPVASRTRRGSTVKIPKRTRNLCDLEYITHERKTGDLDTISGNIKFEAWNWPKKKRTRRNMRQNAALSGNTVSVVGPSGTDGNFREAFLMSSVKRKARSGSRFRSTAGINSWKGSLMQKVEVRVLFSQNLDDAVVKQQRKIMKKLGISTAKDCSDATHFVADRFARTKKMLEAMAFGKPIVTPLWLDGCEQATCIIDENNYILRDAKKEKEIGFNMPVSLSRARSHPLLKVTSLDVR